MAFHKAKCIEADCDFKADFNFKGKYAEFCHLHKTKEMCNVKVNICTMPECIKAARYGLQGGKAMYCSIHALFGTVLVKKGKVCTQEGCEYLAAYGYPKKPKVFCLEHKVEGMSSTLAYCQFEGCEISAGFGPNGKKLFCKLHKSEDDITSRKCDLCEKCYSYTYPRSSKVRRCFNHKEEGMIRVKKCVKCHRWPSFGNFEDLTMRFCKFHKEKGMANINELKKNVKHFRKKLHLIK